MRRLAPLVALLPLASPAARASDTDQFGFGARPIAMGGAFTALATDFSGSYYNTAAPAAAEHATLAAGFSYGDYALRFASEAGTRDAEAERQAPLSAFTLGISRPLDPDPDALLSRVALSIGLLMPTRVLVGADVETAPGVPQYFLYGSRRDKIGILPAIGLRILPLEGPVDGQPILCLGGGATVLADIAGDFTFDLSATAARAVAVEQKLTYDVAPNVGIFFWPLPWLSLGAAYRGQLSLKADFDVQIIADGTNLFPLQLEAVTLFQPHQVALGAAVDLPLEAVERATVALDLTWANWSAYHDPFVTIRPVVPQADIGFDDIVTPRLGFEVLPVKSFALRAGYYWQPTPIPEQGGGTNLVDLDKHVFSLGLGWTWWREEKRPAGAPDDARPPETNPFSIDVFFQLHHLIDDRVEKDPSLSPDTGSFYEAGGDIYNFGIQITIRT